ncbi:hypothetical protein Tco_0075491, partial [Tanacetum coccineum]
VEVSNDEGFSDGKYVVCFNDVKYPLIDAKIRMFKERSTTSRDPITSTSIRSITLIASTSNAQAASTSAPRGYKRIALTRYVLGLRAPNDPTAPPPLAPQKRKSEPYPCPLYVVC